MLLGFGQSVREAKKEIRKKLVRGADEDPSSSLILFLLSTLVVDGPLNE